MKNSKVAQADGAVAIEIGVGIPIAAGRRAPIGELETAEVSQGDRVIAVDIAVDERE